MEERVDLATARHYTRIVVFPHGEATARRGHSGTARATRADLRARQLHTPAEVVREERV